MSTIQLEISDTLAQKLLPYHNKLPQLLELGLQMWGKHEEKEAKKNQEYSFWCVALGFSAAHLNKDARH